MGNNLEQPTAGKKRWKGGRPRKSPQDRRSSQQNTRLSVAQKEKFDRQARALKLKPADLARRLLLGLKLPKPVAELNQQAWDDLLPLVNELRSALQLARSEGQTNANQTLIENLLEAVQTLRRELRDGQ